jgi:hypothetical protein
MIATCPNCAITSAEELRADNAKKPAITWRFVQGVAKMHTLDERSEYLLVFLVGVITAAALRHIVHVYGGIPREEIRSDAMIAIPLIALVIVFFRRKRDHK